MSEEKRTIKPVANNYEKGGAYSKYCARLKKAKVCGFYLECLWLLYAMLEDRTSAVLYYLGFTSGSDRNKATGSKKIKEQVRLILNMGEDESRYNFDKLSGKLSRIQQVITWAAVAAEELTDYQKAVKKAAESLASDEALVNHLNYLNEEWRDIRNQFTHALFNKDPDAVAEELIPLIEQGTKAARALDNAAGRLKGKKIRTRFRIQ